jgi:type IV fimbrial biogenesis protein FimT
LLGNPQGRQLLVSPRKHLGFTLVELLVSVTIAVILIVMAMPSYVAWTANAEVRNGAESIASGLRYAQTAAVHRNNNAQFILSATGWTVTMVATPLTILQRGSFSEGARNTTVVAVDSATAPATTVAFNALGQIVPNATNVQQVDISSPVPGTRTLRVRIGNPGSGIKMCDPFTWAWPDPKGCPP